MSQLLNNRIVQYLLIIAVIVVLQGLSILTSVSASIGSSVTTLAGMITLVAVVWIFTSGFIGAGGNKK